MQPLNGQIPGAEAPMAEKRVPKHDPAPSRWAYRLHRLWLTPAFRKLIRVGVPFTLSLVAGTIYFSNEARRDAIQLAIADLRAEKLVVKEGATFIGRCEVGTGAPGAPKSGLDAAMRQVQAAAQGRK